MRRKYNVAFFLLASVIILLGMAELPLLYTCFFDAAAIVKEQETLIESLETAPHDFIKNLQEPLWQEKRPVWRIRKWIGMGFPQSMGQMTAV